MISIFSKKDFRSEVIQQFITQIPDLEQKKKVIKEWQAAIESGKIYQLSETQQDISFIHQIFGEVLGYDYQNSQKWNIEIKPKTDTDSTKPDAVLGYFGTENKRVSCAVIELKSATQHLDKIQHRKDFKGSAVEQAFRYAHKLGRKCNWIIVSNFIEIRLYHASDSSKYENFEIQTLLNPQNFERFMYLLSFRNLFLEEQASTVDKLFLEKREEEKVISTEFYNGYAAHRELLFYNLLRTNTSYKQKPLELLSLTQIIIDRFLFICFVRDTIPLLDILGIVKNQTLDKLTAREDYFWREIKDIFVSLDKGFSHRIPRLNIPKFNGGLFSNNEKLNELYVHDDFLISFVSFLLEYDFESQLNVTILGHIFEQSIADLEELKIQIQGKSKDDIPTEQEILEDFDRRKKDGIFYTPNYITKQIIKNSVGKWLEDKRNTLLEKHKTETKEFWLDYSQQLKAIKIIDPACGSGAFLTEVVIFLATEWKIIEKELENHNPKKTNGNSAGMFAGISQTSSTEWQRKREIIDNNIFGVDLNFESVEITKLSLWIMSANKTVSLSNLSENIKQGNSLIADKKITSTAFDWNKNFDLENTKNSATKFDIILGNPPYGASFSESETAYIRQNYQTAEYQINSYVIFYEKALQLLNQNGYLGFITPNTFTYQHFFTKLRSYFSDYSVDNLTKHAYKVFEDANVGDTISWIIKNEPQNQTVKYRITTSKEEEEEKPFLEISFEQFVNPDGTYNIGNSTFLKNIYENTLILDEVVENITMGIKAYQENKGNPKQTKKIVDEKPFTATKAVNETFLRCVNGKDFHRYHFVRKPQMFLSYGNWLAESRQNAPFFEEEKIIIRQTSDSLICHLDTNKYINLNNVYNIANPKEGYSLKYILAILNSKLMNYIYQSIAQEKGKLFAEVKKVYLKKLPIKSIDFVEKETQNEIISLVETLLEQSEKLTSRSNAFLKVVESSFKPTKITEKLSLWYELEWTEFVEELKNAKAIIPKKDLIEWVSIFEDEKTKLSVFYNQQQSCILKIDELVYQIYGVEKEEIETVF